MITKLSVHLTFVEDVLGSQPASKELHSLYIAEKLKNRVSHADDDPARMADEEQDAIRSLQDKGVTVFPQDDNGLHLWDYQIKGFLKEAANVLKDGLGIRNARSKIDNYVFVKPRKIYLYRDGEIITEPDDVLERPIRAMTAQGQRVTLVSSEVVYKGADADFEIWIIDNKEITPDTIKKLLEYGKLKGLLQWRNGGFGAFEAEIIATARHSEDVAVS